MKSTLRTITGVVAALACYLQGSCLAAAVGTAPVPDTVAVANCNWNHPGANPFMGDVVAAVDRYQDIPADLRARLKARMAKRDYDEIVEIRRDAISGRDEYGSEISDMHFGTRQLCHHVTRLSWSPQMQERGLVYCEQDQCLLVPTVCRNVSRIQRRRVHNEPMHGIFVPGPEAGVLPVAGAEAPSLLLAGPIGWAPVGAAGTSPVGGVVGGFVGGVVGPGALAFAPGGAGGGLENILAAKGGESPLLVAAYTDHRQSPGAVGVDTDRPGALDASQPTVAAPVPEPETWALMGVGLLVIVGSIARRRRGLVALRP